MVHASLAVGPLRWIPYLGIDIFPAAVGVRLGSSQTSSPKTGVLESGLLSTLYIGIKSYM